MFFGLRVFYKLLIGTGIVYVGSVSAQIHTADLNNSEWKLAANPFACSLTHKIPSFGQAVFSRKAGAGELFILESQGKVAFPPGPAQLETLPPVWRSDILPVRLNEVTAVTGTQSITLRDTQIAPVVSQLSMGVNLMYTSQKQVVATASSEPSVMRVVLTAKNFADAHKKYQQCVENLIPYTFAQIARTSINYGEKPSGLTAANKAELGKVARYVGADSKVVGVFVDGHSDNSGTAEERDAKSKQAAEWVSAYLAERGVAADKITTRWHADKFLIANNKTDAGRAENRRVTIRLEDEAAHKEFMKKEEENRKTAEKNVVEKAVAENPKTSASASVAVSSSASSSGRMSPEEISRMVEGLDIVR
ncbi:MAG: OmpA family protein [Gammaproteobacteria bacterium]|nr:MAG: OmpA family protein [Gammaproteobacteria bacterium]